MSRRWLVRIGSAVAAWLLLWLVAAFLGMTVRPVLLGGVIAAIGCAAWLVLDASASARPSYWRQEPDDPVRGPGEDRRLDALVRHLGKNFDAREWVDVLHADLVAITDDRLMARHGLSRSADAERAAAVLGPDLSRFLVLPRNERRPLTIDQLDHLLTRIEAL